MSSQKPRPPTAKRSPSILVTDVRSHPGRPAPFAGASGRRTRPAAPSPATNTGSTSAIDNDSSILPPISPRGNSSGPNNYVQGRSSLDGSSLESSSSSPSSSSSATPMAHSQTYPIQQQYQQPQHRTRSSSSNKRFGDISISKILSDVSDIPSAQSRSPHRGHHHSLNMPSSTSTGYGQYSSHLMHYSNLPTVHKAMGSGAPHHGSYPNLNPSYRNTYSGGQMKNTGGPSGSYVYLGMPQSRGIKGGGGSGGNGGSSMGRGGGGPGSGGARKALPPRLTQNLPPRTTKVSEKLVLIPESPQPEFAFEEEEEENMPPTDDDEAAAFAAGGYSENRLRYSVLNAQSANKPQSATATATGSLDSPPTLQNRKTYAERLPKDRRAEKFPRVTAYCISESIRIVAAVSFLRENHQIRPRIYNEALYAPYYLPLLPGDDDNRVKSSPGGIQIMEQMMNRSEQLDHHYEYYSALEGGEIRDPEEQRRVDNGESQVPSDRNDHHSNGMPSNGGDGSREEDDRNVEWTTSPDFDPSEPQDFSPPSNFVSSRIKKIDDEDKQSLIGEAGPTDLNEIRDSNDDRKEQAEEIGEIFNNDQEMKQQYQQEQKDQQPNGVNEIPVESRPSSRGSGKALDAADLTKHAEVFIFSYGVVVFWNFTEHQEKEILADLTFARVPESDGLPGKSLIVRPVPQQDIETEELHFTYSPNTVKPRIYNDMITLRSGDHMTKLSMSHAIAQSTKLSRFEARMDGNMHDVRHVPKMLALTGQLGLKREEVLKISGKLFKLRVDVNLSSNVLDTPDFFWEDEPSLNPLYSAVREYLEIEPRILVLNERCMVFLQLTEILTDSIAEYNMSRITWIIIILIALSLAVSTLEIAVRFVILRENVHNHA